MTSPFERSRALHARARERVRAWRSGVPANEPFDALACDVARHQADAIPGIARLFRARGVSPMTLRTAAEIPAVPTDAFKLTDLAAFPEAQTPHVFRTSGTTLGARGVHRVRDVETYNEGALAFGRHHLARDVDERLPIVVVGPPPDEASDSSLTHMIALFVGAFGEPASRDETYFLRQGELQVEALLRRVTSLSGQKVLLLGTSFAFVHLLDALGSRRLPLGEGTRVMQTGGYKGRSREVAAGELRRELARLFDVPTAAIVSEYGMTELSSQFYETTLFDGGSEGVYAVPPWARVVPVDPETLRPVAAGDRGIARIVDLLNVDSAVAIQTQDVVRQVEGGFELHGRLPGAAPRGCSIAIDELLER